MRFVLIDHEGAQAAAKAAESRWQKGHGRFSPFDGIPTTIKDTTNVKAWPTRYGSHSIEPRLRRGDNAASHRSVSCRGPILLGKTTTPEFGWKALTDFAAAGHDRAARGISRIRPATPPGVRLARSRAAGVNPFNPTATTAAA